MYKEMFYRKRRRDTATLSRLKWTFGKTFCFAECHLIVVLGVVAPIMVVVTIKFTILWGLNIVFYAQNSYLSQKYLKKDLFETFSITVNYT